MRQNMAWKRLVCKQNAYFTDNPCGLMRSVYLFIYLRYKNMSGKFNEKRRSVPSRRLEFSVRRPTTLLDFLMNDALRGVSRNKAANILRGRSVMVDGVTTSRFDFALQQGMTVCVSRRKGLAELNNKQVKIVYEDKFLVVVEKGTGILSMQAGARQYSVKQVLDEYFMRRRFKCTAHLVHRLDRDTSGLMIYAKDVGVQQYFEANWQDVVTDRRYVAVVCGRMEQDSGTAASWLKDNKAYVTYSSAEDNGGKYAVTHFRTLERAAGYSLVELELETGRKNQIRVHLKDLGYPVAGDRKYGNGDNPIGRLALHAFRLNFFHPVTGEEMKFETPFPVSFMRLFEEE